MRAGFRQGLRVSAGTALIGMATLAMGAAAPQANDGGPTKLQMVEARAELKDSINAKKLKEGQPIRAKLEGNVTLNDGHELTKDTVLEGHVDQVQASEKKSDSTVVVTFDKAVMKDGQALPLKATVTSIWEPAANPMNPGMSAPGQGPGGETRGGGAASGGAAPAGGGAMHGGAAPANSSPEMPPDGMAPQQGHGGVPGVTLHSDIHDKSSATFTATRRNVDVPSGTQMDFELVVVPPGVQVQ